MYIVIPVDTRFRAYISKYRSALANLCFSELHVKYETYYSWDQRPNMEL